MSILSDIFGQAESGSGSNVAAQPASMVDPFYGQYAGFANQYGSGAAGIDNYAAQVLAANPNATLGDVYSGYYSGTGNPAVTPGFSALPGNVQSNIANSAAMFGADVNTPAADLFGSSGVTQGLTSEPDFSAELAAEGAEVDSTGGISSGPFGSGTSLISGNAAGLGGLPTGGETFVGQIPSTPVSAMLPSGLAANIGLAPGVITAANQWFTSLGKSVVQGFDSAVEGMLGPVSNYVTRGFIILIAIALIVVAGWGLMRGGATKAVKAATTV